MRTENGLEFCFGDLDRFCEEEGILRHHTVNGVAERMNRTLLEKARCMLSNAGLGKEFWAEAVSTACYFVNENRSPSTAKCKIPIEVWSGSLVYYSRWRVFGCPTMLM